MAKPDHPHEPQRHPPEATLRAAIAADAWDATAWQQLAEVLQQAGSAPEQVEAQRAFLERLLATFPTSVRSSLHRAPGLHMLQPCIPAA